MHSETPSEPPEEPYTRSNPALLSPASPKPIHFPTPTNIPVLQLQMDVDHNQIETHMADPAMHNTEVRPDFWRDPNEQQEEDHASPYSTGGDATEAEGAKDEVSAESAQADETTDSKEAIADDTADPEPVQVSNDASHQANALLEVQAEPEATTTGDVSASSDPSVPAAAAETAPPNDDAQTHPDEAALDQAQFAPALNGTVDVQALLDTLQVPPAASTVNGTPAPNGVNPLVPSTPTQPAPPGAEATPTPAASGLSAAPPGALPARPPPQEQPLIHPNYVHSQHIRDYHPHAAHSAFQPQQGNQPGAAGNVADPSSRNYVPPVYSPSSTSGAAAQTPQQQQQQQQFYPAQASPTSATPLTAAHFQSALQTPISAQGGYPSLTNTPIESRRESKLAAGETPSADDRPWDASIQAKYDRFIDAERGYVSEGRWEQFPTGSRLFVGNLSSEKVTKRDIFHVFHSYGELAQVSIKQAYGFVQFLRTEDCQRALEAEQGTWIRDKRIHLEVSKPQKNRNSNQNQGGGGSRQQGRRSRSPVDYGRGKAGAGVDRYVSGRGGQGGNQNGYRNSGNFRSPSPPRSGGGYRDRYDDRGYRARSPDYSRGGGRSGYRSPSPQRRSTEDDDLPLPRRASQDVPDVQILVLDQLERDFISWVEKAFSSRGVRVDVLLLSPRLSEQAVIRRQIVEGVTAVCKLTLANQNTGRIGLQIFDRRGGAGSVKFEEYDQLDPPICAELVIRAKGTHAAPAPTPNYGGYGTAPTPYAAPPSAHMPPPPQQGYGAYGAPPTPYGQQQPPPQQPAYPPAYAQPQGGQAPPPPQNLQNLITSLDPAGLQNLLAAMNQQGQQAPQTPQSAGYGGPNYGQQQQAAMAALQQNPGMVAGVLQQQQQQAQYPGMPGGQNGGGGGGQQNVNMQDILARLGTYKQ